MKFKIVTIISLVVITASNAQDKTSYASSTFCFPVTDLKASVEWYGQLLGDVESFAPAEGVVEFQLNETTWLQLFEGSLAKGAILRLEVTKIQAEHKRLKQLEVAPDPVELVPGVVSYFDFRDPDGNMLSFYQMEAQ